jgi:hypothetical protein
MDILVTIPDAQTPGAVLTLKSASDGYVRLEAGGEARIVPGALIERAAANALNVPTHPATSFRAQTRIGESDAPEPFLEVTNHPADRNCVAVLIGPEPRIVQGRALTIGVRQCLAAGRMTIA